MTSTQSIGTRSGLTIFVFTMLVLWPFHLWSADPINGNPVLFSLAKPQSEDTSIHNICCGGASGIFSNKFESRFQSASGRHAYWLKIKGLKTHGILDFGTIVDDLTLFAVDPVTNEVTTTARAGDQVAATKRMIVSAHQAFELSGKTTNQQIFVRIVQDNELAIRPRFIAKREFAKQERDALLAHYFVMGSASIIVVFNLLLGLLLKKTLFIYYSAFVGSLMVPNLVLSGLGPAYIWPTWSNATGLIREFGMVAQGLFFGLMIHRFLNHSKYRRLKMLGIFVPAVMAPPVGLLWWILPEWQAHILIARYLISTTVLLIIVVVFLGYKKEARARILLPTLLLVAVPTVLALLLPKNSPIAWQIDLFSIEYLLLSDHLFELVILVDSLLFSLLFAFQFRVAERQTRKVNQELAELQSQISRRIINAVDNERRRIAADLHDTAGQGMLSISSKLSQMLRKEKFTKNQQLEISRSADYSRSVVGDIRRISHDLHPAAIDHLGWRCAVEELFGQLSGNTGISCGLKIQVSEEILSKFQKLHLYRISQEIVTNIAKHSGATKCDADYNLENDRLVACISDNGQYQQSHEPFQEKSTLGQMIIDQRVKALNGEWKTQVTDATTQITIEFPVCECTPGEMQVP